MTIRITDPYGNPLNTQSDVLPISTIAYEAIGTHSLTATSGFPNEDSSSRSYVKITTTNYFCNRLFRIGDRIHISGIISTIPQFQQFINRESGHYIVNLITEDDTTASGNKGFVNVLYVSPSGSMGSTNQTIDPTTDITALGVGTLTYSNSYLINENLQTHMLFKITTREADTYQTLNSINV